MSLNYKITFDSNMLNPTVSMQLTEHTLLFNLPDNLLFPLFLCPSARIQGGTMQGVFRK